MPTMATARPTGAKSSIANGSPMASCRYCEITMFGGVPIRVIIPPRIVANDSGIRLCPVGRFAFFAASMSSGIKRASAATLLMTAESPAPTAAMMAICNGSGRSGSTNLEAISSTAPDDDRPRLTIKTRAMIATAEWPKPENTLSLGTSPSDAATIRAPNATRS